MHSKEVWPRTSASDPGLRQLPRDELRDAAAEGEAGGEHVRDALGTGPAPPHGLLPAHPELLRHVGGGGREPGLSHREHNQYTDAKTVSASVAKHKRGPAPLLQ